MPPAARVPGFDGKGSSYIIYEQQVRLWRQVANLDPSKRAAALILQVETVARQVCLAAGSDSVANNDGAEQILGILKDYFAPDAVDSAFQEVARFLQFKRTDQTMDVYPAQNGIGRCGWLGLSPKQLRRSCAGRTRRRQGKGNPRRRPVYRTTWVF